MLVAMNIEDMIDALGHIAAGIAGRLDAALDMARQGSFDLAMLDVNLAGSPSFPVAAALRARNIPFLFATGYGVAGVEETYRDVPILQKPFRQEELGAAIIAAVAPPG
jgi:DNA-binding response OmpR family regulator